MSRAERFALAGALLLVLLHAAAYALPALATAFEYRRALLAAQPWRLLTAHFVHINWAHVLVNAAAWVVVARLFALELGPSRQVTLVAAASVAIGAGLAFAYPEIAWYRGFSGVLHALFFAGATSWAGAAFATAAKGRLGGLWLPLALWLGGAIKVVIEQPVAGRAEYADWLGAPTVPQAHLLGSVCGVALGIAFLLGRRSAAAAQTGQRGEEAEQ